MSSGRWIIQISLHAIRFFEQRIHAKYPEIKLIGSAGPDVTSNHYTDAWEFYRKEKKNNPNFVYAIDEHYYMPPQWFFGAQ